MFVLNGLLNHLTDYNKIRTLCAVRSNLRDRIVYFSLGYSRIG